MALVVTLGGLLLIVTALLIVAHATRTGPGERIYGVEDAVDFVMARIAPEVRNRIGPDAVRRILEWEVFYLQGLAQGDRRQSVATVAGDYAPAVEFIVGEIAGRQGIRYSPMDVSSVLRIEVEYLQSIGAIGERVGGAQE